MASALSYATVAAGSKVLRMQGESLRLATLIRRVPVVSALDVTAAVPAGAETVSTPGGAFSIPNLRVQTTTGFSRGPEAVIERVGEGVIFRVVFEENPTLRASNLAPLQVSIDRVEIQAAAGGPAYPFTRLRQVPGDANSGTAFTLQAEMDLYHLPDGGARAEQLTPEALAQLLELNGGARFRVHLSFRWRLYVPPPPKASTALIAGQVGQLLEAVHAQRFEVQMMRPMDRLETEPIERRRIPPPGRAEPPPEPQTFTAVRSLQVVWPRASNAHIYQGVFGGFQGQAGGWRSSPFGWWQPVTGDLAYILPDEFRVAIDRATALPAITALLLPGSAAASPTSGGSVVENYRARVTIRLEPDFAAARIDSLQDHVRSLYPSVKYARIAVGGYRSAKFRADQSLGLRADGVFTGSSVTEGLVVNPEVGFSLTFEGPAEFIRYVYARLLDNGIRDWVDVELEDGSGRVQVMPIPVRLQMSALAQVALETALERLADGGWQLNLTNRTQRKVNLRGLQLKALEVDPVTQRATDAWEGAVQASFPLALESGQQLGLALSSQAPAEQAPSIDGWDVRLEEARPDMPLPLMLEHVFTASTSLRGWRVPVVCVPLKFFDRLQPHDKAALADVVMVEVELRRAGSTSAESLQLTLAAPEGEVLLSRSVAEFVREDISREFEYRKRSLTPRAVGPWSSWERESGGSLSFVI